MGLDPLPRLMADQVCAACMGNTVHQILIAHARKE
jgi:hypothetical protein